MPSEHFRRILVTGGAGYIGSHTVVELSARGHVVVILDNFSNSSPTVVERLEELTSQKLELEQGDVRDLEFLRGALERHEIDAVIHFAALKSVGESHSLPLEYYENNVGGTIDLLRAMQTERVHHLVFSSSAAVYGQCAELPVREEAPLEPANPYGRTKLMMEQIIDDVTTANGAVDVISLRYFNAVGAHPSGRIGDSPTGAPDNLMPYITQVAAGQRDGLRVFGDDYPTRDGSGVRDYIHVVDLAIAHVKALEYLFRGGESSAINLGRGIGSSVLELIETFEKVTGQEIPYEIVERRPGDVAEIYADPTRALELLGWRAERDLETICRDAWKWQRSNPNG